MIKTYDVLSNQTEQPIEVEVNVDTVYIRENIRRVIITSFRDNKEKEYWCYDESQYTLKEYIALINELQKRQDNNDPFVERMKTAEEIYEENKSKEHNSLDKLKYLRIQKLKEECTNAIYKGFMSESTGYTFGFNALDQTNFTQQMLLIVASPDAPSIPILWKTLEGTIVTLNAAHFLTIVHEAEQHKRGQQIKYWELESQILAANTLDEVDLILW